MLAPNGGRMAPRRVRVERLIAVLGAAVLILGVLLLWLVTPRC